MLQCQRVFLKSGMTVCQCRVAGIAGFGSKTEIGNMEISQRLHPVKRLLLCIAGMERHQQAQRQ
jgi:hypothetical protein